MAQIIDYFLIFLLVMILYFVIAASAEAKLLTRCETLSMISFQIFLRCKRCETKAPYASERPVNRATGK